VVDGMEHIETHAYDYSPIRARLLAGHEIGVLNLDWDMVVSPTDLHRMKERAWEVPMQGFVAPYKLHCNSTWAHRHPDGVWVDGGDPLCELPGWGAIYVPRHLLEEWAPVPADPRLTDQNFGAWCWRQRITWPIDWTIRAIHLHV
jgi:hypothetical protein